MYDISFHKFLIRTGCSLRV